MQGYTVLMTARSLHSAQQAAQELGHESLIPAELDITNAESITNAAKFVSANFGHLDILINNAAIHYDTWQSVLNADLKIVHEAMDTNVYGAWRMVQAFLPLLKKSAHARIVNVSSGAGATNQGLSGKTPAYAVSKVALNALAMMLATSLKGDGIMVNAVCPGWTRTDMDGLGGRPIQDGAKSIVLAATLAKNGPTGQFFRDGQHIMW